MHARVIHMTINSGQVWDLTDQQHQHEHSLKLLKTTIRSRFYLIDCSNYLF